VPATTVPEVLTAWAADEPERRALVFLDERGDEQAALTYGDLHARALAMARHLTERHVPGERALLVFQPGLDVVVAYLGCLYAGVVAVPVAPPRRGRVSDATRSIVRDCAPAVVLTVDAMRETLAPLLAATSGAPEALAADRIADGARPTDEIPRACSVDDLAFLQYTSGSTSAPKGVMVSHGNLAANQEMIRTAFGHDRDSTVVGWAPLFHDQGLIGNVLQPLWVGATTVLMSPTAFIRRPMSWLSAISRYRAHTSGGPDFAFGACIARAGDAPADLDLSCWEVAFDGAEPIRPSTLRRFAATFAPHGFRPAALFPCYGLAEATLLVTGSGKGRGPRTVAADVGELERRRFVPARPGEGRVLAGSGAALPGEDLRIVDPATRRPNPPGAVGEIWVSGAHVAQGYWRRPEATADTFRARLEGADGDRAYLRTGDLGVVVDGEVHVVGRAKDMIIIRGRNHYPHDVEQTVRSAHPAVAAGTCAAFGVPGDAGETLVVVAEIDREHRHDDLGEVSAAIRATVVAEHEVALTELVLTRWGTLSKTSSGKIMRAATRRRHLEHGFDAMVPDPVDDRGGVRT